MPSSSEKLERLLNLTAALLETPKPLTAAEVARKVFGYPEDKMAFRRTFERDKEDLREMGIPIDLTEIVGSDPPETGYRIPKDQYYLRDPGLEPDELAALQLAASTVRLEGIEGAGGLWKLGGAPSGASPDDEERPELTPLPVDRRLIVLWDAVSQRKPVTFRYHDVERTVDPYRLDFQRDHWYVSGYDHVRDDERNFRVDRIDGEISAGERHSFQRPSTGVPGARVEPWQLGEGEPQLARVLIDAHQAIAIAEAGADSVAEERADGSVILEMSVTNLDGFRSFVLGFLEHAEVLSPPEVRADLIAWLEAL